MHAYAFEAGNLSSVVEFGLVAVLLVTGLAAGIASTLFGIGGGILMVPLLHYGLGFQFHEATALSLLAIAAQSPFGVWQHARRRAVDWKLAIPLAIGGLGGVALGIWLEPKLGVPLLKLLFAALMMLAAMRLIVREPAPRLAEAHWLPVLGVGILAGVTAKLLGIGGGLVTVPVLTLAGTAIHVAVGSSLVPVFTNAAFASAQSLATGLEWQPAIPLAAGALIGVPVGATAAHALPAKALKRVFAAGLTIAAVYIALTSDAF